MNCARALAATAGCALLLAPSVLAEELPESAEVEALHAEADRLAREGRFDEAIPLAERALSIQERALGPDHPGVLKPLNDLALLYRAAGDYAVAEALFERILEIATASLGPQDPAIAITVNNLGMLYWEQGDRARAEQFLEKALEIWEHSLGPDDPRFAVALDNLASLYRNTGDLERAEPLYEKALAIWEKSPDPVYRPLVDTLRSLGAIRRANGDYERAESLSQRELELAEKVHGAAHAETAGALSNLASVYYESRDYAHARPLFERALAIMEGARGPDHPEVASALSNLAAVDLATGQYVSAKPRYERALEIRSAAFGPDHLATAASLENLASLYRAQGEYARAQPLCERALAIRVQVLGSEHLDVAMTTSDLGAIHWALGDFAAAESFFERALLIREKALGPAHPVVAISVDNLASAQQVRGKPERVQFLYEAALGIREKALDRDHPAVAQSLRNLGLMYWQRADWDRAGTYLARSAEIEEQQISLLLPAPFEDQVGAFLQALSNTTDLILSFQGQRPDPRSTTRLAFETVLRRKGRELSVEAGESTALQRRLGEEERAVLDPLLARRNELGRLIIGGADLPRSESLRTHVRKLRQEVDDLERAAANRGGALRFWASPIQVEDVQASIPSGSALVELVEYRDLDPTRIAADPARGTARLAAFVLRSAGEPHWVPLGEAAAVDASVRAFRAALVDAEGSQQELRKRARDLYDRLAAPLDPHLEGIRSVWIAPDGAATLVPFGALIGPDGRYWVERLELAYLTSGRDLLLPDGVLPSQRPPLVLVAPDYDAERPAGEASTGDSPERLSPEVAALHFPPIALSQTGASDVAKLLGVTPMTGPHASVAAIQAARAPRVLHVALDGFFLPDQTGQPDLRWGSILGIDARLQPLVAESPLLRSGFALAGANRRANDAGRGLLTALQLAGLDLWGTQLVGIATRGIASEEAAIDQAVYALRRSLVVAGVESQFVNLWTTDPLAATELTTAYYERLLAGEGRSEALRSVQLEALRSESRSHPFFWAGFISIGARGPIVWADPQDASRAIPGAQSFAHPVSTANLARRLGAVGAGRIRCRLGQPGCSASSGMP